MCTVWARRFSIWTNRGGPLPHPVVSPGADGTVRARGVPSVVFPCAALVDSKRRVTLYYGAADTVLAVAYANLDDLIAFTRENSF